jgi:hypothetical protein
MPDGDNHQRFLTIVEPNRRRLQGLAKREPGS